MKIRSGFVSNSSSSSFIVGVAKVTDETLFRKYMQGKGHIFPTDYHRHDMGIIRVSEIKEDAVAKRTDNTIIVESFQSEARLDKVTEYDVIFYLNITNDEGDEAFHDGWGDDDEGWYDLDYEIGSDWFSERQQELLRLFNTPNIGLDIKTSTVDYGAGRNG